MGVVMVHHYAHHPGCCPAHCMAEVYHKSDALHPTWVMQTLVTSMISTLSFRSIISYMKNPCEYLARLEGCLQCWAILEAKF